MLCRSFQTVASTHGHRRSGFPLTRPRRPGVDERMCPGPGANDDHAGVGRAVHLEAAIATLADDLLRAQVVRNGGPMCRGPLEGLRVAKQPRLATQQVEEILGPLETRSPDEGFAAGKFDDGRSRRDKKSTSLARHESTRCPVRKAVHAAHGASYGQSYRTAGAQVLGWAAPGAEAGTGADRGEVG